MQLFAGVPRMLVVVWDWRLGIGNQGLGIRGWERDGMNSVCTGVGQVNQNGCR
jgi:hypothetical protein